jgi:hypothetical protein
MRSFKSKASDRYRQAVQCLRALIAEESLDDAERAYAEAVEEHRRKVYAKGAGKQSQDSHVCVHRLLGKRCPSRSNYEEMCETQRLPGADHLSEWRKADGTRRIVSQPYGLAYETLKETVAFCERLGLEAYIDAWPAWHFPGYTLLVEYRKQDPKAPPQEEETL